MVIIMFILYQSSVHTITNKLLLLLFIITGNLTAEKQGESLLKLQQNRSAFTLKIKSTEEYNRGVMEFENSFAHPVGFSSNILGQPSDCRYLSSCSSNKIEELDEEEDEDIEDDSADGDDSTCSSEGSADGGVFAEDNHHAATRSSEELLKKQAFSRTMLATANVII